MASLPTAVHGWATRQDMFAASASPIASRQTSARSIFRSAIPTLQNFDPEQVYAWLKDHVAADRALCHAKWFVRLGLVADRGDIRMPAGERIEEIGALAPWSTKIAISTASMRYANGADCRARTRACCAKAARRSSLTTKKRKKFKPQNCISAIAGALCRPLCRSRRRQHLAAARRPEPHPRSREHARRLSARMRSVADGAGDAAARRAHRCCRCRTSARSAVGQARRRTHRNIGQARHCRSAWTSSRATSGWPRPSIARASNTRAPKKATRHSPADKRAGWTGIRIGCRSSFAKPTSTTSPVPTSSASTSSTMLSTAAFTPKFIPTAPRPTAPSRFASPTPIHRCN